MSIRMIARDLYRLHQEVEELEDRLRNSPIEQRGELREQLRKVRADQNRMRKILDGNKELPPYRKPR